MSDLILKELDSNIQILTMNNPQGYNVLSIAMIEQLQADFDKIAEDKRVRAVIIRAQGKAFCAGHDLREMSAASTNPDRGESDFRSLFSSCSNLMQTIVNLPQPVIAQVQGVATAAGCQLVASCDLAVSADHVKFGVNGVNIGLFCSTPMIALTRNLSRKHAFEMLTTGDFITAERAAQLGLINHAVPDESLESEVMDMAVKIAQKLPSAVKIGKEAFYRQLEMPLAQAYDYAGKVMTMNMLQADTVDGVNAFLNKKSTD